MKKQGGFTLIELVVVIVILGILAVTAAPRFLNLQDDARNASLEGLKGAMQGAAGLVYGRAAIDGVENVQDGAVSGAQGQNDIQTVFGYPDATADGIGNAISVEGDFIVSGAAAGGPSATITYIPAGGANLAAGCSIVYTAASAAGATPQYSDPDC
jgi:MSHA pilin protein MshA